MANDVAKEGDGSSALRRVRVPSMKNFRPMEETSSHLFSKIKSWETLFLSTDSSIICSCYGPSSMAGL